MAEGNWLITSLIVILMVVLLAAIISFIVVAFLGNTFFESGACCCPVCTTAAGGTATATATTCTTATTTANAKKPHLPPARDAKAVTDAASLVGGDPLLAGRGDPAAEVNANRLVQVLYIDGKPVAAQTTSLTNTATPATTAACVSDVAVEPEPTPVGPITSAATVPTTVQDSDDDESDAVDEDAVRLKASAARKDARLAKTAARQRSATANGSLLYDQTTETLTPAQAAAVTAYQQAKAADVAAAIQASALTTAGEPVPDRISSESGLPASVRELVLDAAADLPTAIDPSGPIGGTAVPTRLRQVLRLVDVALLSMPNEPIVVGADVLCVSMKPQQLKPRLLAVPKTAKIDCPWSSLPADNYPSASATAEAVSVPPPKGFVVWRADQPITVRHGVEPIRIRSSLMAPNTATWTADWSLRVELTDPTSGLPLVGACARTA